MSIFGLSEYLLLFFIFLPNKGNIFPPAQPADGPGSYAYFHDDMAHFDFAKTQEGYWLFEPRSPMPDAAPIVIFLHGYGSINPMIYGHWIRHLVKKGNIVVYPRYQKNLWHPTPEQFALNTATAIQNALKKLQEEGHVKSTTAPLILAGHSYGGVVAANLAVNFKQYNIPRPQGLLLCAPGTGPFLGGRLDSYEKMPASTKLLIVVSENDHVVGDEFARLVFETATNTPQRNLIRHYSDDHGHPDVPSYHNAAYALDTNLDIGYNNLTSWRSKRTSRLDAADFYGYWKLLDALCECVRNGKFCEFALGNTSEQRYMGKWSDGQPLRELEVISPGP